MIDLTGFPAAFRDYLLNKVLVEVLPVSPAQGTQISPGEEFTVKVRVTNATSAAGIGLKNVRIRIWVIDPTIGKLRALGSAGARPDASASTPAGGPGRPPGAAPNTADGGPGRPPGTTPGTPAGGPGRPTGQPALEPLTAEVTYQRARMAAGEVVDIFLDKCMAEPHTGEPGYLGGQTNISCEVVADVDLDALFPKDQNSATAATTLAVVA